MKFFRSCICLLLLFTTPVSFIDCREHHHKKHKHHSRQRSKSIVQEKGLNDLHLWTYDEILRLLDEVESGKIEKKCSRDDCRKIDRFLALLAKEGQASENPCLDRDIAELIPEHSTPSENISSGGISGCIASISPAFASYFSWKALKAKSSHKSSWKKTKNFVHKHRKEIIIGIAVVVVVVVVVTVVVMTSGTAAPAATSAGGAALSALEHARKNDPPSQSVMREVLDENLESIRGLATERQDAVLSEAARDLGSISAHNSLRELTGARDNDFEHEVIDHGFSTNFTSYYANGQQAYKDYECYAHQEQESSYEFNKSFAKSLPYGIRDSGENLLEFTKDITIHPIQTSIQIYSSMKQLGELAKSGEWKDISQTLAPEVYELVTNWNNLSPSEQGELSGYAFGKYGADIVIPGAAGKLLARGAKASRVLMEVRLGCEAAETALLLETSAAAKLGIIAEEFNVVTTEANLARNIATKNLEHLTSEMQASYIACEKAEQFLKQYKGVITEAKARELIHEAGFPTFPKPDGIPDNYIVRLSKKGAGIKYVDPTNGGNCIRVMPGKPHSPLKHQQKPYIIQMKNGETLDKYGNIIFSDSPEAHILIEEFTFQK